MTVSVLPASDRSVHSLLWHIQFYFKLYGRLWLIIY